MGDSLAAVVEDEFDLSLIYGKAVEAAGFETEVIRAGDEAMTWLSSETPNLVVLDLHLPGVSGVDILDYIRAEPRLAGTCVIVVTADSFLADAVRPKADRVLTKPVNFSRLRDLAASYGSNA